MFSLYLFHVSLSLCFTDASLKNFCQISPVVHIYLLLFVVFLFLFLFFWFGVSVSSFLVNDIKYRTKPSLRYCRGNSGYDFDPKCRPATAVHHHLSRRNPRFWTIQSRKPQSPNWQRSDPLSRTSPTKEMSLTLFHAPLNHRPCLWCASFNFSLF
jgi:hypothetical protein